MSALFHSHHTADRGRVPTARWTAADMLCLWSGCAVDASGCRSEVCPRGFKCTGVRPGRQGRVFLCVNVLWFLHVECNMDINLDRVNVFMSSWIHGPVQPWIRERNKTGMLMKTSSLSCDRRSLLSTCGGRLGPWALSLSHHLRQRSKFNCSCESLRGQLRSGLLPSWWSNSPHVPVEMFHFDVSCQELGFLSTCIGGVEKPPGGENVSFHHWT